MLKNGDKIRIGSNEFVVIALPDETGKGILLRNIRSKRAVFLPDNIEYEVISSDEIIYRTDAMKSGLLSSDMTPTEIIDKDKQKQKKYINENLEMILQMLKNCDNDFLQMIKNVESIRNNIMNEENFERE